MKYHQYVLCSNRNRYEVDISDFKQLQLFKYAIYWQNIQSGSKPPKALVFI